MTGLFKNLHTESLSLVDMLKMCFGQHIVRPFEHKFCL